jgi:hypothetical protein
MEKLAARDYISELEGRVDVALKQWTKHRFYDNGNPTQRVWQWEKSHVLINIFWKDTDERVVIYCLHPDDDKRRELYGLSGETLAKMTDVVRNFAQWVENRRHE